MAEIRFKFFNYTFRSACWFATAILLCYWIYLFLVDDDICLVDYNRYYDTPDHSFPQLSFCLRNPFSLAHLQTENSTVDPELYSEFLGGKVFSPSMFNINYSEVMFNPSSYIDRYAIEYRNGTMLVFQVTNDDKGLLTLSFSGFWTSRFYNCYTLNVPNDKDISVFSIEMGNGLYPDNVRTNNYTFLSLLHYQNQLLTSGNTLIYNFPRKEANDSYAMRFRVKGTELITRRNKRNSPCCEDWNNHDAIILKQHAESIGCIPPYFSPIQNIPKCFTKDEIANSSFKLRFDDYGINPPCQGMEKIYFSYEEQDMEGTNWYRPGYFWIGLYIFDQKFKEIVQIKEIDLNALIGYIGGYIGLILGYSILQIPEYIERLNINIQRLIVMYKKK